MTVLEPFVVAATQWRSMFFQGEIRGLAPFNRLPAEPVHYVEYHLSASTAFGAAIPTWTVGLELSGLDASGIGLTPQVLRRLTPSGALKAGFGVRLVVTPPSPYLTDLTRWTGYLTWDFREPIRRRR